MNNKGIISKIKSVRRKWRIKWDTWLPDGYQSTIKEYDTKSEAKKVLMSYISLRSLQGYSIETASKNFDWDKQGTVMYKMTKTIDGYEAECYIHVTVLLYLHS